MSSLDQVMGTYEQALSMDMDRAMVMDMMPYAAQVLGEHPKPGGRIIGVIVEMMGVCGRCNTDHRYICKDGPVFRMDEVDGLA